MFRNFVFIEKEPNSIRVTFCELNWFSIVSKWKNIDNKIKMYEPSSLLSEVHLIEIKCDIPFYMWRSSSVLLWLRWSWGCGTHFQRHPFVSDGKQRKYARTHLRSELLCTYPLINSEIKITNNFSLGKKKKTPSSPPTTKIVKYLTNNSMLLKLFDFTVT